MPSIPRTQQYYPTVPLSELSDLYSKGDNRIGGNRVFIISYLPKTLRISSDQPFYNKYFLYIENTPNVTSIEWNSRFYLNNLVIPTPPSITIGSNNKPDYEILFEGNVVDNNTPTYDKLIITCTINNNLNLELEHSFIKSLDAGSLQIVDTSAEVPIAYAGDKTITNYIINNIKDFLSPEWLSWNDSEIDNVT
ncbi:MAG: hypothetical protein J0I84_11375, partial [Terrimonas sp.]|nr:hypothetical protein [Terrimonas sp.]